MEVKVLDGKSLCLGMMDGVELMRSIGGERKTEKIHEKQKKIYEK